MNVKRIKLIQVAPYKWNLVSPKGHIIVEDMLATTLRQAVLWAEAYISSYPDWSLEVITMEKKK